MSAKKSQKESSSVREQEEVKSKKADTEPAGAIGGKLTKVANTKVSRRTVLKGTAAAAAVVGVSAAVMKGMQFEPIKEQLTTSTFVETSVSTTVTTGIPAPPALVYSETTPFAAQTLSLNVNGTNYVVTAEPRDMLVNHLRERLGLIGTKRPCNKMDCGACTVLIDGAPYYSCQIPVIRLGSGQQVLTIEAGLSATTPDKVISALQNAWIPNDAYQCGYCAPGQIMAATALLKTNPSPTVEEIKTALSGHICICGAYIGIIAAVTQAAQNLSGA